MYPDIICSTCYGSLGELYRPYKMVLAKFIELYKDKYDKERFIKVLDQATPGILDQLNVTNACCRAKLMTNIEFDIFKSRH